MGGTGGGGTIRSRELRFVNYGIILRAGSESVVHEGNTEEETKTVTSSSNEISTNQVGNRAGVRAVE